MKKIFIVYHHSHYLILTFFYSVFFNFGKSLSIYDVHKYWLINVVVNFCLNNSRITLIKASTTSEQLTRPHLCNFNVVH